MLRSALACSLVLLGGCSFLFTTSRPDHITAYSTVDCTSSKLAPGIDAGLAILSGAGTIVENAQEYPPEYIGIGLAWTALYAVSAIYGFSVTSSCREAIEQRDQLVEQEAIRRHELEMVRWQQPPPTAPPRQDSQPYRDTEKPPR